VVRAAGFTAKDAKGAKHAKKSGEVKCFFVSFASLASLTVKLDRIAPPIQMKADSP